jgi:hypothetical protein
MKIQEASADIIKGGIMFPNPKTSYIEANTQKDEETNVKRRKIHWGASSMIHASQV